MPKSSSPTSTRIRSTSKENYDGRYEQPVVLPSRIPNLLLNGSALCCWHGHQHPAHNLGRDCSGGKLLIESPESTLDDLLQHVKGPDFPTAGIALVGKEGEQLRHAYGEGRRASSCTPDGRRRVHSCRAHHDRRHRLPYQVNKAALIEKIADLVRDKKIEHRRPSRRIRSQWHARGHRTQARGPTAQIKNLLYKFTAMRSTFAINMMAIVDGQPRRIGLKRALELWIDHRRVVITRRSEFQRWRGARPAEHILVGLLRAIDLLDFVIAAIRGQTPANHALTLLQGAVRCPNASSP
ncbi:MAG: DNA gyrase subunit A [Dehalococcoidia bacterium]